MSLNNKILIISLLLLTISCGRKYAEEDLTAQTLTKEDSLRIREEKIKESLEKTNQIVIKKERERIKAYSERNSWKLKEIDGVFLEIISESKGKKIEDQDKVTLTYKCFLLNGEKIYDSEKDGEIHLKIGVDSEYPLGLQKALLQLNYNTKARIIIPSSLAYGLSGDGKKIPPSTTLIYEVDIK